jgi:signal transduction histidine kinase
MFDPAKIDDIPPGHSRFAFEYAGLSFVAPQKVRFRYKLEGFDKDWVEAGTRRVAYYTNLRPGAYRFRVLARNNDGFWNESGSFLSFRLEPHFYQTYWFFAFLALAVGVLGYSIYRWRVRQVEAQFNAVLQERNRIAREIHDTLAQGFAGVSVQLEIVARLLSSSADAAREHLDQARLLVRNSLAEARRSIWELRSQSAESEDLAARISKMAAQVGGSAPGKVKLQVHGTYRPLTPKMEDELLKIAQEALTNALRHADAENINIDLAFDAKKLRMTISDDGRGFSSGSSYPSGWNGHFGLQGMRERAENIDAELNVDTAIGKGTRVSVEALVN